MEFYATNPDTLEHYGVLGMHWGQHKARRRKIGRKARLAAKQRELKKELKKARAEADEAKSELARRDAATSKTQNESKKSKPNLKDFTDEDLSKAIRRLELEQKYADLTKPAAKKKMFDGKQFVADVVNQQGKKLAGEALFYYGGSAINRALGKDVINIKNKDKDKDKDKDD